MAPEIIEARPYKGTSVDIFALGVTLFAMVTGVMPFERRAHKDNDQLYNLIYKGDESSYWDCLHKMYGNETYFIGVSNISDDFKKFIFPFFKYNYFERLNLEQIKSSAWLVKSTASVNVAEI